MRENIINIIHIWQLWKPRLWKRKQLPIFSRLYKHAYSQGGISFVFFFSKFPFLSIYNFLFWTQIATHPGIRV